MKNKLQGRMDFVDAAEDIRMQISFMNHAIATMFSTHEETGNPGDEIICGMKMIFDNIEDQARDLSDG